MRNRLSLFGRALAKTVLFPFVALGFLAGLLVLSIRFVAAAVRTGYEDGSRS